MATGDQNDFVARLLNLMPTGWFPSVAPNIRAVLQGWAVGLSAIYSMIAFVKAQTRLATAQGGFLDLFAQDYFGTRLSRLLVENDTAYRARIKFNLTAPRGTWSGMEAMLQQLTGTAPIIVQPNAVWQTGGIGSLADPAAGGGILSLGRLSDLPTGALTADKLPALLKPGNTIGSGLSGTLLMPCQVYIYVTMPGTGFQAFANINGIGSFANATIGGGGGIASIGVPVAGGGLVAMVDPNSVPAELTQDFILDQIAEWMPAAYSALVNFT